MKIRDVANLSDYLPEDINLDADINDLCIVDKENYLDAPHTFAGQPLVTYTPLTWAIKLGLSGVVKQLLEHGANPNIKDSSGRSPLHLAKYRLEIAKLLIEAGADLGATDSTGNTALDSYVTGGLINATAFVHGLTIFNPNTYRNPLLSAIHNHFENEIATILEGMGMKEFNSLKQIAQYIADYADLDEKFSSCWNSVPRFAQNIFKAYCKTTNVMDAANHTTKPFLIAYTASKTKDTNSSQAGSNAQPNPNANTAAAGVNIAQSVSTRNN